MRKKNVFLIGLNDFNRCKLERIDHAERYNFHGLLSHGEVIDQDIYDVAGLVEKAVEQLAAFPDPVDAVIGYMDFPVSTMVPVLCRRFDLASASLESTLKCEHKYWSRLEQSRIVPEHIPRFTLFHPWDDAALEAIELPFPFWVKPVKSFGSHLGFRIDNEQQFHAAVAAIRANIERLAEPFNYFLELADLPREVAGIDGHYCLAEEIISRGAQCTLEGYVFDGEVGIHGVVDSIRFPNTSAFSRYQYPSRIAPKAQQMMQRVAERFLTHIGYDNAEFNMEFFWDEAQEQVWLLEINTRIAQHHSDLFEKVDGVSNHQVAVQVACGERPSLPHGQGPFPLAAACFIRHFQDAFVTRVPSEAEIAALTESIPGAAVQLEVHEGAQLSKLFEQDSYSYILAIVYLGAENETQLLNRYGECLDALPFQFEDAT